MKSILQSRWRSRWFLQNELDHEAILYWVSYSKHSWFLRLPLPLVWKCCRSMQSSETHCHVASSVSCRQSRRPDTSNHSRSCPISSLLILLLAYTGSIYWDHQYNAKNAFHWLRHSTSWNRLQCGTWFRSRQIHSRGKTLFGQCLTGPSWS